MHILSKQSHYFILDFDSDEKKNQMNFHQKSKQQKKEEEGDDDDERSNKKKTHPNIKQLLWSQIVEYLFVLASVFNIFLPNCNSSFPFLPLVKQWKRIDFAQIRTNRKFLRVTRALAHTRSVTPKININNNNKKRKRHKTADQQHRYLHLELNFYDNLSRSQSTHLCVQAGPKSILKCTHNRFIRCDYWWRLNGNICTLSAQSMLERPASPSPSSIESQS